jgi:nitrite reductase (NADH) large subunit
VAEFVIIGAGPAGLRCAERLAQAGRAVTVIGAEPGLPYNRVALSQHLAGDYSEADLITHDAERLAGLRITYRAATRVTAIDRAAQTLLLDDGDTLPYGELVLALGSRPFRLPLPGADLPGVLMYRTLDEVRAMLATAREGGRAIVIGGGLLGLEAAVGLASRGIDVTVLHGVDRLMERQLDHTAAGMLTRRLRHQAIAVELGAATVAIAGEQRATGVILNDGRTIAADLIVMAVGIRPETQLARDAGLVVERGIVVDDSMLTSDLAIHAIGECAQHRGQCCGLVAPAYAQAEIAARHLLGEAVSYAASADTTALKVAGAAVWSGGDIAAQDVEALVYDDPEAGEYRKFLLRDHHLVGAVLYGETTDAAWYTSLIGANVAGLRGALAFGRAYAPLLEAAE